LSGVELVVDERMEYDGSAGGGVEDYRDIEPAEDSSGEDAVESEREDEPGVIREGGVTGMRFEGSEEEGCGLWFAECEGVVSGEENRGVPIVWEAIMELQGVPEDGPGIEQWDGT
jgi:hypothetical protein